MHDESMQRLRQYYEELHRFGLRLSQAAGKFQRLVREGKWPERDVPAVHDPNDPADPLVRSIDITREFEFLVGVTGAFSSGKSSVLNALLEQPDLLPVSAIPLTAVCTAIRQGDRPRMQVRYVPLDECFDRIATYFEGRLRKDFRGTERIPEAIERPENFAESAADQEGLRRFAHLLSRHRQLAGEKPGFEERARFIAGGGILQDSGGRVRHYLPTPAQEKEYLAAGGDPERWVTREWLTLIRDVTLWVDSPLLENGIVFLDLPGLNCREDYHRRAIQQYCNMADAIVVTAFQPGNQADEDIVDNFKRLSSNYREKLFFVLNRVDQFVTEPDELVRSFDYLSRDCIGSSFPRDRCFFTSAYFARTAAQGRPEFAREFDRFTSAFRDFRSDVPGVEELIARAAAEDDPGGVAALRAALRSYLQEEAYDTKIDEILSNYETVLERFRDALSPHYDEYLRIDPKDLLLRSVIEFLHQTERGARDALHAFRYEYLRGGPRASASLASDLKPVLERVHRTIERSIVARLNRPIAAAPPREDPVSEFDLRRIADEASADLRREFLRTITTAVTDRVRRRFREELGRARLRERLQGLFRGTPETLERLDRILERYELLLDHSTRSQVRKEFHAMPGGRDLKRLERTANLGELKAVLTQIFTEFYPDWIYQNIYSRLQDDLWLAYDLDTEDLEAELREFFDTAQGRITSTEVLEKAHLPEDGAEAVGGRYEAAGLCKEVEGLRREKDALRERERREPQPGAPLVAQA